MLKIALISCLVVIRASSWEMIFSKSTEVVSPTELDCCRRVVQLCCDCLLVLYRGAADKQRQSDVIGVTSSAHSAAIEA